MNYLKACTLLLALVSAGSAQAVTISGVVMDRATSLPVGGAEVRLAGASTRTDRDGRFAIASAASGSNATLTVSEARYASKQMEISPANSSGLEIKLQAAKQRLIVTTDIGGADPDDEQSMVHLLVSANEFDLEGLVGGLAWVNNRLGLDLLNAIIDDYGKVLPNLRVQAAGYPGVEYLKSITKAGQPRALMAAVGEGQDSPGSELIIAAVDKDDPRPVWINAWGGMNTLAQALWKVRHSRSPAELEKFIRKIRVYDILGQDDAGAWMVRTFPGLFYIRNKAVYGWAPSDAWVATNVQSRGPLGRRYRSRIWAIEGDSPAFMHVYANGLNDPNEIDQGGWGGRFSWTKKRGIRVMDITQRSGVDESPYDPYEMYSNTEEGVAAINRWKNSIYNDLAARMEWTIKDKYADANHHPIAVVNGDASRQVLEITASPGSAVTLDAAGSSDPDHNALSYAWTFYQEPSSYRGAVPIQGNTSPAAQVSVPTDAGGKTIHVILELHDDGSPNLYAYRRVIITVR